MKRLIAICFVLIILMAAYTFRANTPEVFVGINLGLPEEKIHSLMGAPDHIYQLSYAKHLIYDESDYFTIVGINNEKTISFFIKGEWEYADINSGVHIDEIKQEYEIEPVIELKKHSKTWKLDQAKTLEWNALLRQGDYFLELFFCSSGYLSAMQLMDEATAFKTRFNYNSYPLQDRQSYASQVFLLTNFLRSKKDIPVLKKHPELREVSYDHALDMVFNNYFGHVSPVTGEDYCNRLKKAGIEFVSAGENLVTDCPDAIFAFQGLVASKEHRKNMLNSDYTHTNIGTFQGVFVQKFIKQE